MKLEFNNGTVEIWTKNEITGVYAVSSKNPLISMQLNEILQHYPHNTRFVLNEEPVFIFKASQIKRIGDRCPIMRKILAQICIPMSRAV